MARTQVNRLQLLKSTHFVGQVRSLEGWRPSDLCGSSAKSEGRTKTREMSDRRNWSLSPGMWRGTASGGLCPGPC
jgi:hypothetical protein